MSSIAERLKTIFARSFIGQGPVMQDGCVDATLDLLDGKQGLAIGEVHGDYGHARFVKSVLSKAASRGVGHLYVEMFHQDAQGMLDLWQDGDKPGMLVSHINNLGRAYSAHNWQHYWDILNVARENGIRVLAIEPRQVPATPYPVLRMMARNFAWQNHIEAIQKQDPTPFLLYCGRGHLQPGVCGQRSTIHDLMGISAVFLHNGTPGFLPSIRRDDLHHCWVPRASDQTVITGLQITPSVPIRVGNSTQSRLVA